ncbi:nucleotide pyrophosphohydrolase [Acutalibacter caecimuris]|uniref:nucleotide pyrophosphohydrolase n=1 Tax=Acutalibacter caecimuris TaxID=3093657 RepID=UPI002AC8B08A|nr:nucleotide pyrophosphohydrolase [Acutalibacter sp. M00118]
MGSFGFAEMQAIQEELQARYFERWGGLRPEKGRDSLLWMMIEAGEAADIIKKRGDGPIVDDPAVRRHFVEELCDVLMYLNDVMLCYGIGPEELEEAYREKHRRNMGRWPT